eukprot:537441_1
MILMIQIIAYLMVMMMMMVIQIQRLDKGIATLVKTAKDVSSLKEEKKIAANALIEKCDKERIKVDAEKAIAMEEKRKASVVLNRVNGIKAAKNAVDCLTKASLTELKALKTPDQKILDVTKAHGISITDH